MISYEEMKRLSAEAQDLFPLTQEQAMIMQMTRSRDCIVGLCEERIMWMLNQAFENGKSKQ